MLRESNGHDRWNRLSPGYKVPSISVPLPRDVDNPAAARGARQTTAAIRRRLAELPVHGTNGSARRAAVRSTARPTRIADPSGAGSGAHAARPRAGSIARAARSRAATARPAQSVRAARRQDARRARAAIRGGRACAAARHTLLRVTHEWRRRAGNRVGHTGDPIAAVRARRAGPALGHARSRGASRHAHVVLVAGVLGFAIAGTAIARRVAGHRCELAHVPVGLAAHRITADSNRVGGRDDACDRVARAVR